jgi:hypothetical protein
MASQVLSGSSNPIYTNNTGQNVRVVINYMAPSVSQRQLFAQEALRAFNAQIEAQVAAGVPRILATASAQQFANSFTISINWAGVSANASSEAGLFAIGRNLATVTVSQASGNNAFGNFAFGLPTEIILAPGQTFSAVCSTYNIVVIPEAG